MLVIHALANINRRDLLAWLEKEVKGGKVFGITFVKSDGTLTTRSVRLHVTKGVKGVQPPGQRPAEDARHNLLSFWDMNGDGHRRREVLRGEKPRQLGYRRCNVDRIVNITVKGVKYQVV